MPESSSEKKQLTFKEVLDKSAKVRIRCLAKIRICLVRLLVGVPGRSPALLSCWKGLSNAPRDESDTGKGP